MRAAVQRLFPGSWLVQGIEGSIECRAGRTTRLYPADEAAEPLVVEAPRLGFATPDDTEVPADAAIHAEITRSILADRPSSSRDTALLTAGVLLYVSGRADRLADGVEQARAALADGKAFRLLQQWMETVRTSAPSS